VIFEEQLSPKKLGFLNVTELVGALSDILHVEIREGERDLLVFDVDMKPTPPDKDIEDKACVSSLPRNSLSAAAIKETTWDWPLKNHKEPEQKIFKKINLVVEPLQLQVEINKSQLNLAMENHDIAPDAVWDKKLFRLPPLDTRTLVEVFVEYIISPSQFYIRIHSRDSSERCYSHQLVSDRYTMPECFIQPRHLCCVKISEAKWWYRVIIHRVLGKQEVEVFYPDFGNIGTVPKTSLRFLKAILQFQKLCSLKPLVGVVDEYIDGILNIFLCDTSSNEDIYFHHVLKTEGHAIECRGNVPSKGFKELNPLAFYTNSAGPEDIVWTELGYPSQQRYFNEDREISPQSKEITIGDSWDENWIPLQDEMGEGSDAASHLLTTILHRKKEYSSCEEMSQKDWCFSKSKDTWEESWQPSGLVNGMKVEIQKPEGLDEQEENTGTTSIQKLLFMPLPHFSHSAAAKLREFFRFLHFAQTGRALSQPESEESQFEPNSIQPPAKEIELSTAALSSSLPGADSSEKQ
ncbi:LOW QUALITY PROTEIN: hypothetical protein MC885_005381, partial [Smutsia gigantea]